MKNQRRRRESSVQPARVPNVEHVAAGLSDDAKSLLLWLFTREDTAADLTESGLEGDRLERAYFELEDRKLVRQMPRAAAAVEIPKEVRAAILPPVHLRSMLGEIPDDPDCAAAWKAAASAIEAYRDKWHISERHAMGVNHNFPGGKAQQQEAIATWAVIHDFRRVMREHTPLTVE